MNSVSDKAIRLFTYLKELSKLRTTHTKDVAKYDEVLWFSDIPKEKHCHCIAWDLWSQTEDEKERAKDIWIEVHKPNLKSPPEVPDELEQWIKDNEVSDSAFEEPGLRDKITITTDSDPETGEEITEVLALDDHANIFELWMKYTDEKWKPWAEEDRRLQKIQDVYNRLYTIYQRSEKLGEQYEVIVGLGFLLWHSPKSGEVRHPLLSIHARVSFDSVRGIMSVSHSIDGPLPRLEIDMLENEDRPSVKDQQGIQEMVDELDGEPWQGSALEAVLKSLANGISTRSNYDRSMSKPSTISDAPQLYLSPTLILRKRTRRSFVDFYSKIVEQLEDGGEVPDSVRVLVEIIDNERQPEESEPHAHPPTVVGSDSELYFPLPSNDEQKQIAERIENNRGVLVQGPPGTGKSQAIANLVAHSLAKGKRILVTSETPRALEVLSEMLPEEIRELCVMWLGSGPKAQESLERSVQGITQRKINWDSNHTSRNLDDLRKRLDQIRKDQAKLRGDLTACREADTYRHTSICDSYSGTLEKIAVQINADRSKFEWFIDRPSPNKANSITTSVLIELLETDRMMTDDLKREIKMRHLTMDDLIPPSQFTVLSDSEKEALDFHAGIEHKRNYPGYESLKGLSPKTRMRLLDLSKSLVSCMDELAKHIHSWVDRAAREIAADQDRVWRHLLELTDQHMKELSDRCQDVSTLRIVGLEGLDYTDVALQANSLKEHLESGKGLRYLGLFKTKVVKDAWYLVKSVRVEGVPCKSIATLQRLIEWLNYDRLLGQLDDQWKAYTTPPDGNYATRIAAYQDLCEPLRDAIEIHPTVQELKNIISQHTGVFSPHWHLRDEVESLCDALEAVESDEKLRAATNEFDPLEHKVSETVKYDDAHPNTQLILDAIRERDRVKYEQAYEAIKSIGDLIKRYEVTRETLQHFIDFTPKTASEYKNTFSEAIWENRFNTFQMACNWAGTDRWLTEMCSENRAAELGTMLEQCEIDERKILKEMAAQKSWQHCMRGLGEFERQALIAWMQAVKKIRGGTGRHAERNREEARRKLVECRSAIPAWVMPLYQVVQTTSPEKGLFDLVIIDEASQSGPEAILLNYIGTKIVVVGDDKQIAPVHVGVNRDDVTRLQEMHLKEIPHRESFDLEGSFFSQAELRFPGRVRLREHFRCMPEIIQFSNRLSYSSEPLIPLRQYGADRLEPCKATHVSHGYRTGKSPNIENRPEAEAIVEQVVQCLEDSAYEDKSFGVISLLGNAQTTLIAKLLMKEVGADEMENRRLLCGSPYDFQGDERNVVFLSMVDAPQDGRTCRMVRDSETQRRFNVAASRAKDQLWLFHSPTLNDLRTECLRYRLLEHCLNPTVEQTRVGDYDIDELRRLAKSERRDRVKPPEPFDSWFEVDVFLRIVERGYRIIPQHEVANRKIDLYVEGLKGGLAVECHGDKWHGPDRFNKDMERKRQLERCGCRFAIIWGSQFYRHPAIALQPLWEELDRLKIYPEHRWEEEKHKKELLTASMAGDSYDDSDMDDNGKNYRGDNVNSTNKRDHPDLFPHNGNHKGKRHSKSISASLIQNGIISALERCPHNTCTTKSLTKRVLKELGIITRGNPRLELEKRVKRNVGVLVQKGQVQEYKAKNNRLRLLKKGT
ncbi:MAG: AAA domain-containing protein [Candidatus Zixiibacteriota bacterium]